MDTEKTCPDCEHAKAEHTSLMGCLADGGECDCDRSFPNANATVPQARAEGAEAQARAERGTDPDWATEAIAAIHHLKDTRPSFTPDDIWERLEHQQVPPPREPRALGPILKAMAGSNAIRPMGFTESRRRHGAPVRIYEAGGY